MKGLTRLSAPILEATFFEVACILPGFRLCSVRELCLSEVSNIGISVEQYRSRMTISLKQKMFCHVSRIVFGIYC